MRSVSEHQQAVIDLIRPRPEASLSLRDAEGLVLTQDVHAPISLPVFDNSGMDGYALRAEDIVQASPETPIQLPVLDDIPAGRTDIPLLEPGTAHRIMTGAPVPPGATAVVPVEDTDAGTETVTIYQHVTQDRHIRKAGSDVLQGTVVLHAGQVATATVVGLAAALGLTELMVRPRLRAVVFSTGTELVHQGHPLSPGQIYESNGVMLSAALRDAGVEVVGKEMVTDDVHQLKPLLDHYAPIVDLIVTSGGVSAGAYEVVKDVFGRHGEEGVEFIKVAMQPGMPQGIGHYQGTPVITLPGNPVSAQVSFEVFLRPAVRIALSLPHPYRPYRKAILTEDISSPQGKRQFRRGLFDPDTHQVSNYGPPASHHLRYLASANCLLDIAPETTDIPAGEEIQVWDLTG